MEESLNRNCPICSENIIYKTKVGYARAKNLNSSCKSCAVKIDYKNNPSKNKGLKNGRFGKNLIDIFKNKYGEKEGDKKFKSWNKNLHKFKSGVNNPQYGKKSNINSGVSYCGWYKSLYFRSSYELIFIINYEKKHNTLPISAEKSEYFVEYIKSEKTLNYIPDFFCPIENTIIEIKPKKYLTNSINILKFEFAKQYFKNKNIGFKIISEKELEISNWQNMIYNIFYELLVNFKIILTKKSLNKFKIALKKKNMLTKLKNLEIIGGMDEIGQSQVRKT